MRIKHRQKGRPRKRPNRSEFELLYYNNSLTIYELADYWNVRPQTIYNWATYYSKNK